MNGNYLESSSYVDSIPKNNARPADAHVLEHREHYTFNAFATAISIENFEEDQTHNFESAISSSPKENSSDYENAWLHDYLAKIQDTLHEELNHVEQKFNTAEEETKGDELDMSVRDFACFTGEFR